MRRARFNRRIVVKVCIFLLLGAIVNILVAWGCAIALDHAKQCTGRQAAPAEIQWWQDNAPSWIQDDPVWVHRWRELGARSDWMFAGEFGQTSFPESARRIKAGFPIASFDCEWWSDSGGQGLPKPMQIWYGRWGVYADIGDGYLFELPVRPMWAGLLANTIVYALAVWVVLMMPRCLYWVYQKSRQQLRDEAGRCLYCGYDVRGNRTGTYPECGAAVVKKKGTPSLPSPTEPGEESC